MTQGNFNTDSLTIIVDHIADFLVKEAIHPHYLTIRKLLLEAKVYNHSQFVSRYGSRPFETFKKIYNKERG